MSALHCSAVLLVISKWSQTEYMQTILQKRKIEDDERKDAILEILAVDGIIICCNCGSEETTVLSLGIYCRVCRSFRLFREMTRRSHQLTGTVLDLD